MRRTFRYKAKINKNTEHNANAWLYLCRTLYNIALEQRIDAYKKQSKSLSAYDQNYELSNLKKQFPEFKTVDAQCLQDVIDRLHKAYQGFFRRLKTRNGKAGFPRFKGKNRYDSFTLKQCSWKIEGRYLYIRNVGRFKLFLDRPIEGTIKTITVKRTSTGKWFVSFSCDDVPARKFPHTTNIVGIDVGITNFLVDSTGDSVSNPKYFSQSQKTLRLKQRSLSRKKRGSNRRNLARIQVAKTHEKIHDQRLDFLHKLSNHYINSFQTIYIENLNINNMTKNRHLSKSIADSSWGTFFNLLSYKAEEAGREVIKIPPHNTSQICSGCGELVPKSLSVRVHNCPSCGLSLDRDLNAALNILRVGQTLQALTPALADVA